MAVGAKWRLIVAGCLMVGLPAAAFVAAPAQAGSVPEAPAAQLAGFNASATSAGAQVQLLIPGLVPLGDPTKGNFIQASVPYATSTSSTGPSSGSVASPAWPGDAIATAGNALQTFSPSIPQALVNLLNDPVVARSAYPAQVNSKASDSFAPSGPLGIGSATAKSDVNGTTGYAALTDLNPLGVSKAGIPLLEIASARSDSSTTVKGSSVSDTSQTHIGRITIAGVITIDGIDTTATAASDGKTAKSGATTDIGSVKVAGLAASIGPDGITINGKGQGGSGILVSSADKLLSSLSKLGISITALAPQKEKNGNEADATSGAVLISFEDDNLPDLSKIAPQLPIPTPNSVGVEVSLGLSQAKAAATLLSDVTPGGPVVSPPNTEPTTGGSSSVGPPASCTGCNLPPENEATVAPSGTTPLVAAPGQATAFGVPVRTAWVVIAFLIAVLAAGPLLTYANWQLLRGRTP